MPLRSRLSVRTILSRLSVRTILSHLSARTILDRLSAWTILDVAILAFGLWLVAANQAVFIGAPYDDLLFVKQANALLGHRPADASSGWLGPFDQLTLSKGCVYPLFLALMAKLGMPILVATQAVYLAGAFVFSRLAATVSDINPAHKHACASLVFAILALDPVLLDGSSAVLMREPFYAGISLLTLAATARILLCRHANLAWWMLCGLLLAAFWMTREEGVWLLPALGLMLAHRLLATPLLQNWKLLIPASIFVTLLVLVAALNDASYGVFRLNDFQYGPFPAAYGALSRIDHTTWQRLIPVPADVRAKAYAVSPAARALQPFLEGDAGRGWIDLGCQNNPIPDCTDFQAGWFMWALRAAVTQTGHYGSAHDADLFYRRLATEINTACDTGRIACLPRRRGYLPPLRHIDAARVLQDVAHVYADTASLGPPAPYTLPSLAAEPAATLYRTVTPNTKASQPFSFDAFPGWNFTGSLTSADHGIAIKPAAAPGGIVQSDMAPQNAAQDTRAFSGTLRCAPSGCLLRAVRSGGVLASWPLATLANRAANAAPLMDSPNLRVTLDRIDALPIASAAPPTPQQRVTAMLARIASPLCRISFPVALAWTIWRCIADLLQIPQPAHPRRRRIQPFTMLALATVTAIASRIGFLALLDATSIPVIFRYETPGMVLVPALIALSLVDLASRAASWATARAKARARNVA